MSVSDSEPIYEEHECCAVCGGTVNLGLFDDEITVCGGCYTGGRFQGWLWVLANYRNAFAEKSDFWVIYSDPEKRERLGSAITKKHAWVKEYHNVCHIGE